ncbi:MAG: hypothetical protein JWM98_1937, partial [Thermoleophilia bacterium]|nr:hypothetical protein [Thermoleophilia bacterium]
MAPTSSPSPADTVIRARGLVKHYEVP